MSDESISDKEDIENLLYISKKINIQEYGLGEDGGLIRHSVSAAESKLSTRHIGSEIYVLEDEINSKFLRDIDNPKIMPKLKAFNITWSYGINTATGVKDLTDDNNKQLLFASVHHVILYDYEKNEMKHIEGHRFLIKCLSTDIFGDWIVSSDNGIKDGCLIIWEKKSLNPVFTLLEPYSDSEILLMAISPCARYLITIGRNEKHRYQVDFWLWTTGDDRPADSLTIDESNNGLPVKICYNFNRPEHIMLVFEYEVCFVVWDSINNKLSKPLLSEISNRLKFGKFTEGTYLNQCTESYVSSRKGFILIFRSTLYSKQYNKKELSNSKSFINAVKVSSASIGAMISFDNILVIGDAKGHIYFFDGKVRILYWIRHYNLGSINGIAFPFLSNQRYSRDYSNCYSSLKDYASSRSDIQSERNSNFIETKKNEMNENIIIMNSESNTTFEYKILLITNFFISTNDCNVYLIDFHHDKCTPLFQNTYANVSALESHQTKSIIVIGYENGHILAIDYDTKEKIASTILPASEYVGEKCADDVMVTCIKYSPQSLHLLCGRNNGEIWILEPTILTPLVSEPFRCTKYRVEKIDFTEDSLQFAYYDSNQAVILFNYDSLNQCWQLKGKIQSHYERITDLKFFIAQNINKSRLFTIGADRNLVEYNNIEIRDDPLERLSAIKKDRIEQSAIPLNFEYYFKMFENKKIEYFLIVDDKHKLKLFNRLSKVQRSTALGPAYGCFRHTPIKKIMILPYHNLRYTVFICKQHIGLHILPPDGNPYKFLGYLAHPVEITDVTLSFDGKYAFTFGVDDRCVLQWEIKIRSVEICYLLGGTELEPYYCLLEGGKTGWLFNEIQDLFCYMQILQQENIDLPRRVSDSLNLSEIPDLIRTCGYYPSNFELENIMIDIRYKDVDETNQVRDEITFTDFVKLFINHRPAYSNSLEALKNTFSKVCEMADSSTEIDKDDFVYLLQNLGEPTDNLETVLCSLLRASNGGCAIFDEFPKRITVDFFCSDLLGIDTSRVMDKLNDNESEHNDD